MIDKQREAYREEAYELLSDLEGSLLELEEMPDNAELIAKVFRVMHTIKGSGAMFGFDDIAAFTHEIENIYDRVRNGELSVTKHLIDMTLEARDTIKLMLDGEAPEPAVLRQTVTALKEMAGHTACTATSSPPRQQEEASGESVTYRIRFKPQPAILQNGTNPLLLLRELEQLGDCTITAHVDAIPCLEFMNPEACYMSWDLVLTTGKGINAIKDVFIFVEDQCEVRIHAIDGEAQPGTDQSAPVHKRLGEILVERGDVNRHDLQHALTEKKYLGQILVEQGVVTTEKVESALAEQQHVHGIREKARGKKEESISSLRVASEKLDLLVNLVGELVTVQARLTQTSSILAHNDLTSIAEEVERLTAELRDNTLSIRMLPIGSTFARFRRLIRDLSQELGKEIEMVTEGGETELDKTVIERLNDPLVHLIRNCIDHGIEPPDGRVSAGKPRAGTIRLSAVHSGAHVIIEIEDDGKGLVRETILSKALEKGLAVPGAEVSDRDLFNFIFAPGFSTAKEITNVSGRGVGMDVVKKAIDALGGSIGIRSEPGRGTTVTIKLPLTLAIVDGLLVRIADDHFVLPLSIVRECVELTGEDVRKAHGRTIANIRGEVVPYIKLRKEFGMPGQSPPIEQIVITDINGERVGFVVDHVIGEHQTVIKSLGKTYRNVDAVSGATILGNGTVAMIIDALKLVKNVQVKEVA